jgi:hypothetical protein
VQQVRQLFQRQLQEAQDLWLDLTHPRADTQRVEPYWGTLEGRTVCVEASWGTELSTEA